MPKLGISFFFCIIGSTSWQTNLWKSVPLLTFSHTFLPHRTSVDYKTFAFFISYVPVAPLNLKNHLYAMPYALYLRIHVLISNVCFCLPLTHPCTPKCIHSVKTIFLLYTYTCSTYMLRLYEVMARCVFLWLIWKYFVRFATDFSKKKRYLQQNVYKYIKLQARK